MNPFEKLLDALRQSHPRIKMNVDEFPSGVRIVDFRLPRLFVVVSWRPRGRFELWLYDSSEPAAFGEKPHEIYRGFPKLWHRVNALSKHVNGRKVRFAA